MSGRPLRDSRVRWGLIWHSENAIDGTTRYFMSTSDGRPALFQSRREAREYAAEHYGYIATRADLRREPHGWRMPVAARVSVEFREMLK